MEQGKPAGIPCIQLDAERRCKLFDSTQRPSICAQFKAEPDICGDTPQQALNNLIKIEQLTS